MSETMLRQVMTKPHEISFETVPVPTINAGQALIKMMRIGICGSDIHVWHGEHPYTSYPVTQGHEVSGEVVAVGADVKNFAVGQKVTVEPQVVCGTCHPCRHGKYNLCESLKVMGFQTQGLCAEYVAVDEKYLTLIPDNVSFDQAAMMEPLAVTVHACRRVPNLQGAKVVVMGAGPIGVLLSQTLKAFGAAQVMVTDVSDYRLDIAKSCGADIVVNTRNADFAKAVTDNFGPDKADVIFDCAGNDITMNQAIQNARKGSVIMLLAVFAKMANVDLAKLNDSELVLDTSMMYRHEDFVDAIRFVSEGKVKLEPLMSKHFAFKDYKEAYEYIDNNRERTMKVLVDIH